MAGRDTNPKGRAARAVAVADQALALLREVEEPLTTSQIANRINSAPVVVFYALRWLEDHDAPVIKRLNRKGRTLCWEATIGPLPVDRMWLTNVKPPVLETPHE